MNDNPTPTAPPDEEWDNETTAHHIRDLYDIQPFVLCDGKIGIHFMELSWSMECGTLMEETFHYIDAQKNPRKGNRIEDDYGVLVQFRLAYMNCVRALDKAIEESDLTINGEVRPSASIQEPMCDPRILLIQEHFREWHGASPDEAEVVALLQRIDAQSPRP